MSQGTPALSAQLDLIEWIKKNGMIWAEWFRSTVSGTAKGQDARSFYHILSLLNTASTVFVSREMCDVIEKAAKDLPDIPLQQENMFWPRAFIYFERPIQGLVDDEPPPTKAILSFHMSNVVQSETASDPEPQIKPGAIHVTFVPLSLEESADVGTDLFPFDLSAWTYGKRWETVAEGQSEFGSKVDENLASQRKIMLATHLISAQYVSVVSRSTAMRQVRRRAERMDLPNYGEIVYVTLRRASDHRESERGEQGEGYSHRFVVNGHWRHQWYPSRSEHSLIWIDPFIKGPEEKPLIIKDKVWKVVR